MGISQQFEERASAFPFVQNNQFVYQAQVILGSPSSGCNGVGICRIYMTAKPVTTTCPIMMAGPINRGNGRLRISFRKTGLSNYAVKKHFSWGLFQMIETFVLPAWAQRKLQLTQTEILPGTYTVWETPEVFMEDF